MTDYRPKTGLSGHVWIDSSQAFPECAPDASGAWYCGLIGGLTSWAEPVEDLCGAPPPSPDDYTFLPDDFGLADVATRISKLTAFARAKAHQKYCEIVPVPPSNTPPPVTPPPMPSGGYPQPPTGAGCFILTYTNCDNVSGAAAVWCATAPGYVSSGGACGGGYFTGGNGYNATNASEKSGSIQAVPANYCGFATQPNDPPDPYVSPQPPVYSPPPPPQLPPGVPPPPPPVPCSCPPGEKGEKGDIGLTGEPGEKGEKGEKGDKGDQGEKGERGFQGIPGIPGRDGIDGIDGADAPPVDLTPITDKLADIEAQIELIPTDCPDVNNLPVLAAIAAGLLTTSAEISASTLATGTAIAAAQTALQSSVVLNTNRAIGSIEGHIDASLEPIETQLDDIEEAINNLDLCVGVPMRGFTEDTYECAVLYFSDAGHAKTGTGRYLVVPEPRKQKLLAWANTNRQYLPGSFMAYAQYYSSKGVKITAFGRSKAEADDWLDFLVGMSNLSDGDLFHRGEPRMVQEKLQPELYLRRITYFEDNRTLKSGRQGGEVWFPVT